MRFLYYCLLTTLCLATDVQAQESAFGKQVYDFLATGGVRFPRELVRDGQADGVVLKFSLDHDGKLLNPRLEKGSGSAKIDEATLRWLSSLQPFPAVPPEIETPADFTVPLGFRPPVFYGQLASHMKIQGHKFLHEMAERYRGKRKRVVVTFSLDRQGQLLESKISESSGSAKTDQDTLDWLAALQPFPAIPADDVAPQRVTFPIWFTAPPGVWSWDEDERTIKQMMGNICKGC